MFSVDMKEFANNNSKNNGDCRELAVARYFEFYDHVVDRVPYHKGSDVELLDGTRISVKSSNFTLMGGKLNAGCNTFEGIWRRYYKNVHSNVWAYVTLDWQCYFMDKKEFSKFIHLFGELAHESSSKGGWLKIREHKENKEMLAWLEAQVA